MPVEYWVGGFFVDLSRNQITQNKQSQTLAPKALAVLTCLAKNQGRVVSQDELINTVWPDTIASPNTLQRSIAQLRKALDDDGKEQVYIKTHAKQGYSLECDVRWYENGSPGAAEHKEEHVARVFNAADAGTKTGEAQPSLPMLGLASMVAGLAAIGFMVFNQLAPGSVAERSSSLTFDSLRSITATDDKEFDASYTPNGEYIVFHRYLDKQCVNKIWAKNISTQKEILLTKKWGAYGSHSFSKDGKQMVFLATEACDEPVVTQKNCYDLVSLELEKALNSPQQPELILQCKNSIVRKPIWLSNSNIALLQRSSDRWKLINYSTSKNASVDLYNFEDRFLIDYDYSPRDDLIAVTSIHNDGQHYIEMMKPDGRVLSSHRIQRPEEMPKFRLIYPSFDPTNKQLIFSTGKQLFTLSYEGVVTKINLPFAEQMVQPKFHPTGNSLLLLKGPIDRDIARASFDQITGVERGSVAQTNPGQSKHLQSHSIFERSNVSEDHATFQPNGELIAFRSERSGEAQLWISDGDGPLQLTNFSTDTRINGFDWAADGKSLLVNANGILMRVDLDSTTTPYVIEHPVVQLFQWDSNGNTALALLRISGRITFAEIDLSSSAIREISDKPVIWALKSADGRLIFKDTLDQFWRPGPVEAQRINRLGKQAGKAKSFVIEDNIMYAINEQNQIWSYDLDREAFQIHGTVSDEVHSLTDVNEGQLLMTIQISAKKEIVELSRR